jgi:hypothetical protein
MFKWSEVKSIEPVYPPPGQAMRVPITFHGVDVKIGAQSRPKAEELVKSLQTLKQESDVAAMRSVFNKSLENLTSKKDE